MTTSITPNDIDIAHELPATKFGKVPVIIKFIKRSTRNMIYSKKRSLAKTGYALTESLTKRRLELVSLAKVTFGKETVWTTNGTIYCRPVSNGMKYSIFSKEDLNTLKAKYPSMVLEKD